MPQYMTLVSPDSASLNNNIQNYTKQGWEPILLTYDSSQNQFVLILKQ
jgi:hypothetical protein